MLPEFEINDLNTINTVISAQLLKQSFDLIWNACDYPKSLNFDEDGNFVKRANENQKL